MISIEIGDIGFHIIAIICWGDYILGKGCYYSTFTVWAFFYFCLMFGYFHCNWWYIKTLSFYYIVSFLFYNHNDHIHKHYNALFYRDFLPVLVFFLYVLFVHLFLNSFCLFYYFSYLDFFFKWVICRWWLWTVFTI